MERRFNSMSALSAQLDRLAVDSSAKIAVGMASIANGTKQSIKKVFGDEELLAALMESTVAQKTQMGYADPEAPLIATGALRDSVEDKAEGFVSGVGTEDEKMIYHELGTPKMEARPAMQIGTEHEREVNQAKVRLVAGSLLGHDVDLKLEMERG